jgi:heat shock protein HspQ
MELEDLQGQWQDHYGNAVDVSGETVQWRQPLSQQIVDASTAKSVQRIHRTTEGLRLADLQLINAQGKPVWKSPSGLSYRWKRPETIGWEESFYQYKHERLQLRKQLWSSIRNENHDNAELLSQALEVAGTLPENLTLSQQLRLAAGHRLTTGSCFVHKKWNMRGVIIACEPSYNPLVDLSKELPQFGCDSEVVTPGYHCFLDDGEGGRISIIPEDDISATCDAFPLETSALDHVMISCPEIGGYLPRPGLDAALQQQRFNRHSLLL